MKRRILHIILVLAALFSVAVLFVTYGTVLSTAPFASVKLNGPSAVDSNGQLTAVIDSESRRALIINSDGDLTGVVSCTTTDSPVDAFTDVCVVGDYVFLSGVRFMPDSDHIQMERVSVYDKGGNLKTIPYEVKEDDSISPSIKSLSATEDEAIIAFVGSSSEGSSESAKTSDSDNPAYEITFQGITILGPGEQCVSVKTDDIIHDAAFSSNGENHYATLNYRGLLDDNNPENITGVYDNRVFTAIAIDEEGVLYACDDKSGSLCSIAPRSSDVRVLVEGEGYRSVHVNNDVLSLCNTNKNKVMLCDRQGTITREFTEVAPSAGFSARMVLVWTCGLYLIVLVLALAIRKVRRMIKEGKTEGMGPMLLAVAVVSAVAVAVGHLSFTSYQSSLETRAKEINMCADYLSRYSPTLSEAMEKANKIEGLRKGNETLAEELTNSIDASAPALVLVSSANDNGIGMYFSIYGKNSDGIFYLYDSATEYVMGTSAPVSNNSELKKAFDELQVETKHELLTGHTLRDATQYRLVQIPTSDGTGVAGVIEIGSKMRSFGSSITGNLVQRTLTLLVMILVVYLAYSELRACGRCLFSFKRRQEKDANEAIAILTRPFTFAITMLSSIDSVMTVLIARDLLSKAGMGDSSSLLALPAVMLGVGLVIGQRIYSHAGAKIGLRRLMVSGSLIMLVFACLTGLSVASGNFWFYCAAKLVMSIPFGMLYVLGYSLPRLAKNDDVRTAAAGGVKRTDTSAAALGTVLGGYAAQLFGNIWVYALIAMACIPILIMALNLLPRGIRPLEAIAQPEKRSGNIRDFVKSGPALAIALLIVLPATVATGYASFLFPLFSADLGLSKSDINNIFVLGQLVVFIGIDSIDRTESRYGKWRVSTIAIALLGLVFLLFSINTTLAWSTAVVALVGLLCKSSDGWKAMWVFSAEEQGVSTGQATSAMFATRSITLIVQPFILGGLRDFASAYAIIVIGLFCAICSLIFFLKTRHSSLAEHFSPAKPSDTSPIAD